MPGSVNYIIPVESMTLTDQKELRRRSLIAGMSIAVARSIAVPADLANIQAGKAPDTVDIRPFQNIVDAGAALDQWNTAALAVITTPYSVFQAVGAVAVPQQRVWVFTGVGVETVPPPVSRLTFRIGGALGNIRAVYDLEILFLQQRMYGFFSEPIIYGPNDNVAIQVLSRVATGVLARVPMEAWVIEPKQQTIA